MLLMQRSGKLVDLVNTSAIWTPVNGATSALTQSGISSRFDGTTSRVFQSADYPHMGGATGTFFVWMPRFGVYDLGVNCIFLSTTSASSYLQLVSDGRVYVGATSGTGAPNLANSRNRSVVFSARSGSTDVYFDGIRRVQGIGNALINSEPKTLNFGGYSGGTEWDLDADIVIAGYSSTPWGEAECKAFHDNPWQLFYKKVNTPLDVTTKENRKPILRESTLLGTSKRKLSDTTVVNVPTGDTKKVLSRQPVNASAIEIAWSNSITRSLFDLFTPPYVGHADVKGMLGKISQPTSERSTSLTNNVGAKPTPMGLAYTAFNLNCGVGFLNTGASIFTSYCRMKLNSFTSGDCNFLGDAFNLGVGLYAGTNATFYVELYTGTFIKTPIALTAELGKYYDIVTVTSATNVKLYIDGILMFDQAPSYWNGQGRHGILVTGLVTIGAIDFITVAGWTRALSFAEVRSISNNPWQLFKNQSQLILPK